MQPSASSTPEPATSSDLVAAFERLLHYCTADVQAVQRYFDTFPLKRQKPMFSAQTRKDFATRGLVSDNLLALLSRARGLDLLKRDEQSEYMVDEVADTIDQPGGRFPSPRTELGEYLFVDQDSEKPALLHYRLDQVNYPVPGYAGYDAA